MTRKEKLEIAVDVVCSKHCLRYVCTAFGECPGRENCEKLRSFLKLLDEWEEKADEYDY